MRPRWPTLAAALLLAAALQPARLPAQPRTLTVEEALAQARANAEAVRMRALEAGKAADRLTQARARAFPRLSLQASGSYLASPPEGVTIQAGQLGTLPLPFAPWSITLPPADTVVVKDAEHTYFTAEVALDQPLFSWGRIAAGISIAEGDAAAAGAALSAARRDAESQAEAAYFGALLAGKSRDILGQMRDTAAVVLSDRRRAYDEGATTRQGVLEAEAGLASIEARSVEAEEARLTALEGLSLLTGIDCSDVALASEFRTVVPPLDEQALKEAAAAGSPELAALRDRAGQSRAKLSLEKGGGLLKPDLGLSVSLGVTGQTIPWLRPDWTDTWDWDLRVSLGARASLFDAGSSRAKMQEAEKDVEAAGLAMSQAEKAVGMKMRTAIQQARRAGAVLAEAAARAAFLQEQARNARVSFENEVLTRGEMNAAALAHMSARLEELRAMGSLEAALEDIEHLAGSRLGGP